MRRLMLTCAMLALAAPALAEDSEPEAARIVVDADSCRALTAHRPADDVTYHPGVDVSGDPVVSADLDDPGRLDLADDHEYWLEVALPLDQAIDVDAGSALEPIGKSDLSVGTVTVRNGEVFFNGRQLGSAQSHAIAEACKRLQDEAG